MKNKSKVSTRLSAI